MGDCQNYRPFLGPYYNTGPNTGPKLGDPTRDHNFDNPPHQCVLCIVTEVRKVKVKGPCWETTRGLEPLTRAKMQSPQKA